MMTLLAMSLVGMQKPRPVVGWMIHGRDRAYLRQVIDAAPAYGINHLEFAGSNPTTSDEVTASPEQAALLEEMSQYALKKGIDTYIWIREFNVRDKNLVLDPQTAKGREFWEGRKQALRLALRKIPTLAGVVMSYASTPTEIWSVVPQDDFWKNKSMSDRVRYTTDQFASVVVKEFGKRMYVRDFNHSPNQLKWVMEAHHDRSDLRMHSKDVPQDWQFFYPDSPSIGTYGTTPQVIEMDIAGEYWGQSTVLVSEVEYIKRRWDYDSSHGAIGAVARVDRDENRTLGTPSEINIYAHSMLVRNPQTTVDQIYAGWLKQKYAIDAKSPSGRTLIQIYRRSFEVAKRMYFTLGFWTPKNQSEVPGEMRSIQGGILGKSNAIWDPSKKSEEQALANPTEATVRKIEAEKTQAEALAAQNILALESIKGAFRPTDYEQLHRDLVRTETYSHIWRWMASAFWSVRLAEVNKDARRAKFAEESIAKFESLVKAFGEKEGKEPYWGEFFNSTPKLAADMRNRLSIAMSK